MTYLPLGTPAALTAEETPPNEEIDHSCSPHNRGGVPGRPHAVPGGRKVGHSVTAFLRALADHCALAFGSGMAGVGRDRPAGVGLEPVRVVPVPSRLPVRRLELVRPSSTEPLSEGVAGQVGGDLAGSGSVADPLCGFSVRVPDTGVGVQARQPLVLT